MTFQLSTNPSSAQYAGLFSETLAYLKQSDFADFIISQLDAAEAVITVEIGTHVQKNGYRHGRDLGGTVRWNPFKQVRTRDEIAHRRSADSYKKKLRAEPQHLASQLDARGKKADLGGVLSPAMLLMHELGHAYQRLAEPQGFQAAVGKGKKGVREIENVNVNAIENTVVLELRAKQCLEGVRWRYQDIKGVGWGKDKQDAYEAVLGPFPGYAWRHR
jgi:hypothetical protein